MKYNTHTTYESYTRRHTDIVRDLYSIAWQDVRRNVFVGNDSEKVSNVPKTKEQHTSAEGYADMTIREICYMV